MPIHLTHTHSWPSEVTFVLPLSKSLSARQLIIDAVQGHYPSVSNNMVSLPEDLIYLQQALSDANKGCESIHVGESGTAMRFMLAFLSASVTQPTFLHGSGRQHERPIAPLVNALRALGADITYTAQEGYPPLLIKPAQLTASAIDIDASGSSQYLSALLLIAPMIHGEGYSILLAEQTKLSSAPYAQMTILAMREAGYYWQQIDRTYRYLSSSPGRIRCVATEEADWTAGSYAYLLQSLRKGSDSGHITIKGLRMTSHQGDRQILPLVFETLGVYTQVERDSVKLSSCTPTHHPKEVLCLDCNGCPDIVPALVATCIARRQAFKLGGIQHLRLKESDRILALSTECAKVGAKLLVIDNTLSWDGTLELLKYKAKPITLCTHGDHRIAMALAPLFALMCHEVIVDDGSVVNKSFPAYWSELSKLGYIAEPI